MGKTTRIPKFYAVKVGVRPGIYRSWDECKSQVRGFKGAVHKSFDSEAEATAYIEGKLETPKKVVSAKVEKKADNIKVYQRELQKHTEAKATLVFTDGSSLNNNSQDHSIRSAGIGVFFGENDPRNLSEKFTLEPITNQRAELFAAIRGLEILIKEEVDAPAVIITDSMYTVNCMLFWIKNWARNNWISFRGAPVLNKDLIERLNNTYVECKKIRPVTFLHVPGHCNIPGNTEADQLAVRASKVN